MGDALTRICTVCARAGSQGVKSKNIRPLAGKPLIGHTLEQARASGLFDLIAVSSDSPDILRIAKQFGANVLIERPAELATATAAKLPAIRHCVEKAEEKSGKKFEVVVDLDPTSPLRSIDDIKGAVALLESENVGNVVTAAPARRSPYFNLVEVGDDGVVHLSKPPASTIVRRQDSPSCFDMNASIYVWKRAALFQNPGVFASDTRLFVMPEERSLDIDSELDFQIVNYLMTARATQ